MEKSGSYLFEEFSRPLTDMPVHLEESELGQQARGGLFEPGAEGFDLERPLPEGADDSPAEPRRGLPHG